MNRDLYDTVAAILTSQFGVDAALVRPDATLESLGLDSLTLMEFVFAVEDRFDTRIPEGRLDPRQAGFTLERVVQVLDDELRTPTVAAASDAPAAT
jgi:acyl carrier protein